ncbi:MAG: type II secretion system minor pseudopilin GspI [Magnetococcales bacterium]|nr:type II secretion system minor pseudopilin GspI [Magnetococcales bacterium]
MALNDQREAGFTLLEVVVAMFLIGILCVTVAVLHKQQIGTYTHLEERLAAAQLASNLMELFRAQGRPLEPAQRTGQETMAGRTLAWRLRISAVEGDQRYAVRIQVGPESEPLFTESWLWSAH